MSYNKYIPVSKERYDILSHRYEKFLDQVNSKTVENPVSVFDPLSPNLVEELMLIRQVSMELQKKKEEDMKKAQTTETNDVEIKEANVNAEKDPQE